MAILQVRDIDEGLYSALQRRAKYDRRSVSQEVIKILETYLHAPLNRNRELTDEFLELSWAGRKDADVLIGELRNQRRFGGRFTESGNVFD